MKNSLKELPETITLNEFENLPDALNSLDVNETEFERLKQSGKYQLYTLVDENDGNDPFYSKGNCWVNRIGVYALVRKNQ